MSKPTIQHAPMTRSRAEKLGKLWARGQASDGEIAEVRAYLYGHLGPMAAVRQRLQGVGVDSTARLKTETTLKQKLARSTALGNVQDVAGVRIVRPMTMTEQDQVVDEIKSLWPDAKVIDRRAQPSSGYRGVHVVVNERGFKVEIQVRTQLQHDWAQAMERLGDGWGRQIRYGGAPDSPDALVGAKTRREIVDDMIKIGVSMDEYERNEDHAFRNGGIASAAQDELGRSYMKVLESAHAGLKQMEVAGRSLDIGVSSGRGLSGGPGYK